MYLQGICALDYSVHNEAKANRRLVGVVNLYVVAHNEDRSTRLYPSREQKELAIITQLLTVRGQKS